jgi:predicted ATPase with chaperone activity
VFSQVLSSATFGINAHPVQVETNIERALHSFIVVGLPDNAVRESRERVVAAVKNSHLEFPNLKITINLAPADIKKEGSAYDLPIALGLLATTDINKSSSQPNYISSYNLYRRDRMFEILRVCSGLCCTVRLVNTNIELQRAKEVTNSNIEFLTHNYT